MNVKDLVILVTGASRGIGSSLAKMLNEKHAIVIGIYNHTKIDEAYDTYKCDLTNELEIKKLFQYIKSKYGRLDVLINCAAISLDNDFIDKTKEEFMQVLEMNLVTPFLLCKYASTIMNKGVVVNISSTNATDTYNSLSMDYDASKAGLTNLTKNLAVRLPNIRFVCLEPNWVATETVLSMDPEYLNNELKRVGQKRLLTKEEVALKIIDIISDENYQSGLVVRMDGKNE